MLIFIKKLPVATFSNSAIPALSVNAVFTRPESFDNLNSAVAPSTGVFVSLCIANDSLEKMPLSCDSPATFNRMKKTKSICLFIDRFYKTVIYEHFRRCNWYQLPKCSINGIIEVFGEKLFVAFLHKVYQRST